LKPPNIIMAKSKFSYHARDSLPSIGTKIIPIAALLFIISSRQS
jgi:hypothetical protein